MKKIIFSFIIGLALVVPAAIFAAQTAPSFLNYQTNPVFINSSGPVPFCPANFQDLKVGSVDVSAGGNVSALQDVLVEKGLLTLPFGVAKGYFGNLTQRALASFQSSLGIFPASGYFGPITRARLHSLLCGTNSQNISISSITPSSGPVGTEITITGTGFDSNNYVLLDEGPSGSVSSSDGHTLKFTVPKSVASRTCRPFTEGPCTMEARIITPGDYSITVVTIRGSSNPLKFTVTSNGNAPIIKGIKGPTSLMVNRKETWTVSATNPVNSESASAINEDSQLTYSVNWGDEVSYCLDFYGNPCYDQPQNGSRSSFQRSNAFTHSYSQPGTYTQTFTVRNRLGLQTQTKNTVQVNSVSTSRGPALSRLSTNSGPVDTRVTIHGSGFTSRGNRINFSGGEYYYLSNLSSSDGRTLTFNIPSANDPACAHSEPPCYVMTVQTYPGAHSISVTNPNGTSNSLEFTVTQ